VIPDTETTRDNDGREAPRTRQVVQRPSAKPESAGAKVMVFCSLPNGLRLRNFRMVSSSEPVLGGGFRDFKIAEPVGEEVLINGNRFRLGEPMSHRIVAGFGVTEGVNKDFWEAWLEANKALPMVKNGLIFAAEKRDFGEDEAHDRRDTLSGLEPMQKEGDPRRPMPKPNLTGIEDARAAT
jgi:hypothetical protein